MFLTKIQTFYSVLLFKADNISSLANDTNIDIKYYIGGSEAIPIDLREKNAIRVRHLGAEMLGKSFHLSIFLSNKLT